VAGLAVGLGLLGTEGAGANQLLLNFGVVGNSQLRFTGDTFHLKPSTRAGNAGEDFQINQSTGHGDSVLDLGKLVGTFTIAPFTSAGGYGTGNNKTFYGSGRIETEDFVETATVSGTGALTVLGTGGSLTGVASFDTITLAFRRTYADTSAHAVTTLAGLSNGITSPGAPTSGSGIQLNLTGLSNTSSQQDLIDFAAGNGGKGGITITWSFNNKTLTQLTAGGNQNVSFSGALLNDLPAGVPDGGMTLALLGAALSGVALFRQRKSA